MMSLKNLAPLSLVLALAACGGMQPPARDGSAGDAASAADSGTSRPDGSTSMPDATSGDRCAAAEAMASSTVGCNGGFVSGTPAMNTASGPCTGGGMDAPMGTCMAGMSCTGDTMMAGICIPDCTPGATYVSTGMCPTGFRCFDLGGFGGCYRDCDATHACPAGLVCDPEGSCAEPDPMMKGR